MGLKRNPVQPFDIVPPGRQSVLRSLELLYDFAPIAVLLESGQSIIYANRAALEVLGARRPDQVVLRPIVDFIHPDSRHNFETALNQINEGRVSSTTAEETFVSARGDPLNVEVTAWAIPFTGAVICFSEIGKKKQLLQALQEGEKRVLLAQEVAQAGVYEVDLKTRTLTASDPLLRLFGVEPDTEVRSIDELYTRLHPGDLEAARVEIEVALKGNDYGSDYRIIWPDGSVHWLESRGKVMRDESGTPARLVGMTVDVTKKRITQDALKRSDERFRVALDNSPVGVFELNREMHYTWAYDAEIDTSGLIGRTDEELLGPEQFQKVDVVRRAVLESGEGARTDFTLVLKGVRRSFDGTIEPLRDSSGQVTGLSVVSVDITERKAAEDALLEREANSRRFIEVSPFGMSGRTMDGRIEYANNAFLKLIVATHKDLALGIPNWEAIIPPDCSEAEARAASEVQKNGLVAPYETEYLRLDGSRIPVWVSHAVFSSRGVHGVVAFCVDLADLKRAEEKAVKLSLELEARNRDLAIKNQQLGEISQRKTQFLTSMSHELRTPLNGMIGFLDLLAEENEVGLLNERQRLYLVRSRTASQHLLTLVTDLLDLTRIEAGRLELSREIVHLGSAVDDVLSMIEPMAGAKQLTLTKDVPGNLRVLVDRVRFCQVLNNLLMNAVKYTPVGGIVSIQAFAEGSRLIASVRDTGVGIPLEDQQAVFDHFYQARPRDPQSGAGLGLAITRKLVELHGGTISVKSAVGEGSCFTFTLPGAAVPWP